MNLHTQILKWSTLFLLLYSFSSFAEIRYVSKTGTSIPPFISWETASDSIQKCINISNSGDTIYVGNGVYKETLIVKRGLALIGSGIDSCIIDTRSLVTEYNFVAVTIRDSCLFKNFRLNISDYHIQQHYWWGTAINTYDPQMPVYQTIIEDNYIENTDLGIITSGTDIIIRNNVIVNSEEALQLSAAFVHYPGKVINNIIKGWTCITLGFGTTPYFANNICIGGKSFWGGWSGKNEFYNNLFIVTGGFDFSDTTIFINNVVTGNMPWGFSLTNNTILKNNSIDGAGVAFSSTFVVNPVLKYNNIWNCGSVFHPSYITPPDSTNIYEDPMFVNDTSDFHLQMYSKLIDAGDPSILDKDGTRSDIGLFGGPLGESYTYQDLAPRVPVNISLEYDSNKIAIRWNRNTETDFAGYNVYRDTTADFTIDSTKLISTQTDTFFYQSTPTGVNAVYYKLTSYDNQLNESQPSEQISIILSNVITSEPITIYDYKLYQNYPNPFNPSTKISYILKERAYVKLMIYDLQGELVRVLVNETKERGYYEEEFNAEDLSSGIYIYRIDIISSSKGVPVYTDVRKMIYLK